MIDIALKCKKSKLHTELKIQAIRHCSSDRQESCEIPKKTTYDLERASVSLAQLKGKMSITS